MSWALCTNEVTLFLELEDKNSTDINQLKSHEKDLSDSPDSSELLKILFDKSNKTENELDNDDHENNKNGTEEERQARHSPYRLYIE